MAHGYTWLKLHLQWAGVVPKGAHRRKCERRRRPLPGMMLHQDGSRHEWLEGQALDLTPLRGAPVEMWTTLPRCPQAHKEKRTRRSGHLMCYQNRTTSFAIGIKYMKSRCRVGGAHSPERLLASGRKQEIPQDD